MNVSRCWIICKLETILHLAVYITSLIQTMTCYNVSWMIDYTKRKNKENSSYWYFCDHWRRHTHRRKLSIYILKADNAYLYFGHVVKTLVFQQWDWTSSLNVVNCSGRCLLLYGMFHGDTAQACGSIGKCLKTILRVNSRLVSGNE